MPVSVPPVSNKFELAAPVTAPVKSPVTSPVKLPVTAPVSGPVKAVAVTVPDTSNIVDGVVVPIPILDSEPSIVIRVVTVPASLVLNVMSLSAMIFWTTTPVLSTDTLKSLSIPTVNPVSLTIPRVPDVVSLVFDLR